MTVCRVKLLSIACAPLSKLIRSVTVLCLRWHHLLHRCDLKVEIMLAHLLWVMNRSKKISHLELWCLPLQIDAHLQQLWWEENLKEATVTPWRRWRGTRKLEEMWRHRWLGSACLCSSYRDWEFQVLLFNSLWACAVLWHNLWVVLIKLIAITMSPIYSRIG